MVRRLRKNTLISRFDNYRGTIYLADLMKDEILKDLTPHQIRSSVGQMCRYSSWTWIGVGKYRFVQERKVENYNHSKNKEKENA